MSENQHTEWKETWRDEYLRWVCAFANAEGGKLVIGVNDKGEVVGVKDAHKLLETLPNKVRDILGIMVKVNQKKKKKEGKTYLEIVVDAYPNPVSYEGEYHIRSGSTKQELKGAALDRFLLNRLGKHWDSVPVPDVTVSGLAKPAVDGFRKRAKQSRRLDESVLGEATPGLIDKLNLREGTRLKRAAVLLFHPEPERWFTGAFVKIGFFRTDADLLYHDEVHGDLFTQVEQVMDLLTTKYLKAGISYEGVQRVETLPVPEAALREAVLNAVIHRDYAAGMPVQISVYADKLMVWNPGQLPTDWTVAKLRGKHASRPYNPDVANAFFRAGMIEAWGRGIERMIQACKDAETPAPKLKTEADGLWVEFGFPKGRVLEEGTISTIMYGEGLGEKLGERLGEKLGETRAAIVRVMVANPRVTTAQLAERLGLSTTAVDNHLKTLKADGYIVRVGPAKGGHWEVILPSD